MELIYDGKKMEALKILRNKIKILWREKVEVEEMIQVIKVDQTQWVVSNGKNSSKNT